MKIRLSRGHFDKNATRMRHETTTFRSFDPCCFVGSLMSILRFGLSFLPSNIGQTNDDYSFSFHHLFASAPPDPATPPSVFPESVLVSTKLVESTPSSPTLQEAKLDVSIFLSLLSQPPRLPCLEMSLATLKPRKPTKSARSPIRHTRPK